jgi:hypothetical protein
VTEEKVETPVTCRGTRAHASRSNQPFLHGGFKFVRGLRPTPFVQERSSVAAPILVPRSCLATASPHLRPALQSDATAAQRRVGHALDGDFDRSFPLATRGC